jgi:hypothetical protein
MDSTYYRPHSFTVDNIDISSCSYPPSQLSPYDSLLSFSCNFDNLTMCDMENGDNAYPSAFNFTVLTGDSVPNRNLGPTRDHTSNSTSGAFLYWNRELPFVPWDNGTVHPLKTIEENVGLCVRFAYYVKSLGVNKNGTILTLKLDGCYKASLWVRILDDSQGWQVATVNVGNFVCPVTFYFFVQQSDPVTVSVAFDDVDIRQCNSFNSTTDNS